MGRSTRLSTGFATQADVTALWASAGADLPPYDDVKPMAHALIDAAPERIMWGTDWPHPNKYLVNPNDGDLVDAFGDWVTDEGMRRKIMLDNPAAFYRF
jgi:2-pyrone-4,6-dicarboxylate lactonase